MNLPQSIANDSSNEAYPPMFISFDLPCRFCQYNLRTLLLDSVCPECGKPVKSSLDYFTRLKDLTWLKCLRRDVRIMAWSAIAAGVLIITGPLAALIAWFGFLFGAALIHDDMHKIEIPRTSQTMQWSLYVGVVLLAVTAILGILMLAGDFLCIIAPVAITFIAMHQVTKLAAAFGDRVKRTSIRSSAEVLAWIPSALLVTATILPGLSLLGGSNTSGSPLTGYVMTPVLIVIFPALLLALVVMYIALLFQLASALRHGIRTLDS